MGLFDGQITLEIETLSLVLESCDFSPTSSSRLGYMNTPLEAVPNVVALPFGGVSINKIPTKLREFEMDLNISYEKAVLLRAIILIHNRKIENKEASPWIKMIDQRIPIVEELPRLRAKVGADPTDVVIPTGFVRYFPIYGVTLSAPDLEYAFFTNEFSDFKVTGQEITLLPITEDLS